MTTITANLGSLPQAVEGYSLDISRNLKILGLEFNDTFSTLLLKREKYVSYSVKERKDLIDRMLTVLEGPTNKGFLSSMNLSDFPILSDLLPSFLQNDTGSERKEYISGTLSGESYKWIYNFLIMTLYLFCIETQMFEELKENKDLALNLKNQERELYGRLDPSIRHHLQKRGISIKENTYIGFDTEFTTKKLEENTLISAQLAVTTKTYLKLPRTYPYRTSMLDETTNKLLNLNNESTVFNYKKIEASIQMCVNEVRKLKYRKHDESIFVLSESLRLIKGLSYFEHEDHIIYSLPRSLIQSYIHFGDSFSMKELIQISSCMAKPHFVKTNNTLMSLIQDICSNKFSCLDGKEKLQEEIGIKYKDYTAIEQIGEGFETPQKTPLLFQDLSEDLNEKRLTRQFLVDLFPQKVAISKTKTYYIIAHLTPADLSLLSDFSLIKEELSIVNGSFVTLGKPLRIQDRNVHIRDTMLLAPGGKKSLASIGLLYGEAFNKIEIRKEDLLDMQGFLKRDKERFVEYALRDALISLIHAS